MTWHNEVAYNKIEPKPITLARFNIVNVPETEEEIAQAAESAAAKKTIRQGRDAWEQIGFANSFTAWCKIGAALSIGKRFALDMTGANAAWGKNYSAAFSKWLSEYGFSAMRPSDRSDAIALHENLPAIEEWRASLSDKERRRLRGAQQNVKRWRKETQQPTEPRRDAVAAASAAWRCFVSRMKTLAPHKAEPLWQMAYNEAATFK